MALTLRLECCLLCLHTTLCSVTATLLWRKKVAQWRRLRKPLLDSKGRPSGFPLLPASAFPHGAPCGLGSTQTFPVPHLAPASDLKQKLRLMCLGKEKASFHV